MSNMSNSCLSGLCHQSTRLLYLRDGKTLQGKAKMLALTSLPSKSNQLNTDQQPNAEYVDIILDKSHFYPQGGGQPADNGYIDGPNFKISIDSVSLDESSFQVHHVGQVSPTGLTIKAFPLEVCYTIDSEKRQLHNRLHSAGHLLDIAFFDVLGYGDKFTVGKAYHYPAGPSIEYTGGGGGEKSSLTFTSPEDKKLLIKNLEDTCNDLIMKDSKVFISFDEEVELSQSASPEGLVPNDKAKRYMSVSGFNRRIPCGGTHVCTLGEIGRMTIRKIECKGNITRIGYNIHSK